MQRQQRLALLRALQIGDVLCAVPTLRAVRAGFPDAEITLIGLPWAAGFVRRFSSYIDEFLPFPGYPGMPEAPYEPARTLTFLRRAQRAPFDLAIQLQG